MLKLKDIKNWSIEIEKQISSEWKKAEAWRFNPTTKKKIYSIDTPPPYINSPIHMGHATTYSFMDMFARYKRMKGFEVLFPLGLDRNGLPIEMGVEKKYGISAFKVGREKFLEYCEKLLEETSAESVDTFARLGISFTSYEYGKHLGAMYNTDAPSYRAVTQSTFINLFRKRLIYQATRINNWDPKLQTTIADAEIEYKDIPSSFNHIYWKIKETGEKIVIATTRPELICTCGMIIYNPEDKRYQHLEGKTAIAPLYGFEVPIQEHPAAKIDKGSGIVMMCSAGDVTDIQFFRELGLPAKIAINQDGRMNEYAGFLQGLKVKEARQKTIDELKKENLIAKQEQIVHSTPVSERSGAEIEFIEMPEYYLKQMECKDELKRMINTIAFYPPESKGILERWLDAVSIDWPISRRRFYATPIPLWHASYEGKEYSALPLPGKYVQPWKEQVPPDAEVFSEGEYIGTLKEKRLASLPWKGDERVLDTWFDSSISELILLKYQEDSSFFKKAYPATLRPQGKEIVRTWLYYTLLRGYLETGKACFKEVWIHNHITDEKGRKMSKSVGNVIDPQEIIREFGAETLRFWVAIEGDLSKHDLSCSKERIKAELKTLNKLMNVAKFIAQFKKPSKKPKIVPLDQIFLDYVDSITLQADQSYSIYDFHHPALKLREFLWEHFASHYLELVKNRAYNQEKKFTESESASACYTLYTLLERWLLLAYPIIPQITSLIASDFDVALKEFPTVKKVQDTSSIITKIMAFNSEVWKAKKDKGLTLRDTISGINIPKDLASFEKDFKACHGLK
ncbi:MAG: valine--tRNA ligase [Nanoarchaeota archaeon]